MTALEYREVPAPAGWGHLIARAWMLSGSATAFHPEPITSDGCVEILFNLADPFHQGHGDDAQRARQPLAALVGPTIRPTVVAPTGRIDIIGVRLHPWAAGALLRTPMTELVDTVVDVDSVLPDMQLALERAASLQEFSDRLTAIIDWLSPLQNRAPPPIANEVGQILGNDPREFPSAGWLATRTGRTRRTIERLFANEVGIGPKALGRLKRMQRALGLAQAHPSMTWSRIAVEAGFYDQPHFNREFRELVGGAPSDYGRATEGLTQVFIDRTTGL